MISKEQIPRINSEQVEYIANLARIGLTEEEKESLVSDLSSILGYAEKLNKVDTPSIKGISHVTGLENVAREDNLKKNNEQLSVREKLLSEAPKRKENYIQVPKILE